MERLVDFNRDRLMLCGACGHRWVVDLDWLDRWGQAGETCPGCGITCEHENSPRATVRPDDPTLIGQVTDLWWYHSSTHADWPSKHYDPTANWAADAHQRMGGPQRVAAWAATQRAKALHVGTYEAAIHNMLRRIHNQADHGAQFYLYRVHLRPSVSLKDGWLPDPAGFMGDVALLEVCPPGIDVARYLNDHEDIGGLSLALGRGAIESVQQIAVPLPEHCDDDWVRDSAERLKEATGVVVDEGDGLSRWRQPRSAQKVVSRELAQPLSGRLPVNLRTHFAAAAAIGEGEDPVAWARRISGLVKLVTEPLPVLATLDEVERRRLQP